MNGSILRAFVVTGALSALCAASGCVADRPSRNGVFDENQYLRKDFLIQPGNGGTDSGWFTKSTIVATSVPNPLAAGAASLATGIDNNGQYVNFTVTSDVLSMNNMIEPSGDTTLTGSISAQGTRNQEVIDSWPVTNVDLKYRVNLDGEKTNFYEENQELDWQQRQWVKVNFDKNDESDLVTFGEFTNEFLQKCTDFVDIMATLHPGSFYVDEVNNYWQFAVDVTIPIIYNQIPDTTVDSTGAASTTYDTYCASQFGYQGTMFANLGRQNVTMTIMYSFARASSNPATSFSVPPGTTAPQTSYMPLVVPEKDNIQRKYGMFYDRIPAIDLSTGLWGSRQLVVRHDPKGKQVTYYFAPGFPNQYKKFWGVPTDSKCTTGCVYKDAPDGTGMIAQTNKIFKLAGASTQLVVMDYDAQLEPGQPPRAVGDVRYSMLRWLSDLDIGQPWLAVTTPSFDPRSGQLVSVNINMNDFNWQDTVLARMDYYEQTIGAFNFSPAGQNGVPSTCTDGQTIPLVPATVASSHNGNSTLFQKMQQYMGKPVATWGNLGPSDFIPQHDADFYNALFTLLPYEVFGDPAANPYVVWQGGGGTYGSAATQIAAGEAEAQFQALMSKIDHGVAPFDVLADSAPGGGAQASAFLSQLQKLTLAHRDYQYISTFARPFQLADDFSIADLPGLFQKDSRHCVNGKWETRDEYVQNLVTSYYALIWWHEFGHSLGLDHNFMGSIDRNNYPHYTDKAGGDHIGLYTSSVMEYNMAPDRVFWSGSSANGGVAGQPGWAPYDQAALAFIYSNSSTSMNSGDSGKGAGVTGSSVSGQSGVALSGSGTMVTKDNARWSDPLGYCPSSGKNSSGFACTAGAEISYLFCTNVNMRYTPFCRTFDFGSTPSEIVASQIDAYEWQYLWSNFPQYHQYFSFANYANVPAQLFTEGRRFLATWAFDWSSGELSDTFRRLGVVPPAGEPAQTFYNSLTNQFNQDVSTANQLYGAASEGMILQASGQRPFKTVYDPYFGDTIQQGIAIDKVLSLQAYTALWPIDNYDQNQAAGLYLSPFSFQADTQYEAVAEAATLAMVGGSYDMFAYSKPLGVQQFAMATNSVDYQNGLTGGRPDMKDWIGGYVFYRNEDFLAFFRNLAVTYNTLDAAGNPLCGKGNDTIATCQYDPTLPASPEDPAVAYHSSPYRQFIGPDYRRWIWVYLQDVNRWIAADQDRNVATYVLTYSYNSDIIVGEDDGYGGFPFSGELQLKYLLNFYASSGTSAN